MPTVDLSAPVAPPDPDAAEPEGTLEGLPRRVALTLAELQYLAAQAGDAPLPFDVHPPSPASTLDDRLGQSHAAAEDAAYVVALAALHEPGDSLAKRGLVIDGVADAGVLGALGLVATPNLAVDLDVTAGGIRAKAWHRQSGRAVATLSTNDGIVFELAWFDTAQWPDELARVAAVPEDIEVDQSQLPEVVDLPYDLLDGCGEAIRTQHADLVPVIVAAHAGQIVDGSGKPVADAAVAPLVSALVTETQGRLRGLAADVAGQGAPLIGVVSWLLLADGWRSLRAHQAGAQRRVEVRRVEPSDLAPLLAPVLAEVHR
jgi:hypothetical protein